ncbi:MAG: hypothetical protein D6B27_04065 [Gammaproteobacteria bacterium]|nr:MAG: hypothetical protein D6B27_04065 [Gammaproteobacteria bacterium]
MRAEILVRAELSALAALLFIAATLPLICCNCFLRDNISSSCASKVEENSCLTLFATLLAISSA